MENREQPGSGSVSAAGSASAAGSGSGSGSRSASGSGTVEVHGDAGSVDMPLFDHEKLEVYRVARQFVVVANTMLLLKLPRELRDQFDRATSSILFNIGEGAGKTARSDKQRFYEIARGSTTEVATQLDLMQIRGLISADQYRDARMLLVRVAQMLSRMCAAPRAL